MEWFDEFLSLSLGRKTVLCSASWASKRGDNGLLIDGYASPSILLRSRLVWVSRRWRCVAGMWPQWRQMDPWMEWNFAINSMNGWTFPRKSSVDSAESLAEEKNLFDSSSSDDDLRVQIHVYLAAQWPSRFTWRRGNKKLATSRLPCLDEKREKKITKTYCEGARETKNKLK